jgi:hypothetical protein
VDTSGVSWEQILDVRKDDVSRRKLRNLRLFLYANYEGKPSAFIEDDLKKRIEDYENACKDHGLNTCLSALSVTFGSKYVLAASAGAVSGAFLGSPLSGITTAAIIELGGVVIEISKAYASFRRLKRDHPLAYIIDLQGRFKR